MTNVNLPPLIKFCHAEINKDNEDMPLPLANTLSHMFPDRPPREKYVKYDDLLLTDDQVDAEKKCDDVLAKRTQGKSLFVEVWRRLSEKFQSDWKDVEFSRLDSLEKSIDFNPTVRLTSLEYVTPFDCNELVNVARTSKVLLTSNNQELVMKDSLRLWDVFNPAHKDPDNTVLRTVVKVPPKLFDVLMALQLPEEHSSETLSLSVYIAGYHAFDVEVNKSSPSLIVQGRYPLRNPCYHDVFIFGLPKDAKLIMFGMVLKDCERDMGSCMLSQHIFYELNDEHQLSASGGMAFKVAHRDANEGQLVTDQSNQ